ncbi:MAG: PKD domain-containing protein, partial [Bacteroidales bacterium]
VFDAGSLSKTIVTGTITIPEGTAAITTRMRVSMKYNGEQTACETFSYGEVEDYTVIITESGEDTQAPTAPTNLSASNVTETSFTLSWNASTDNVGVTGYDIYQNGSFLASTANTSYDVTGLNASTTYNYYVKAKDAAGNVSAASNTLEVTTDTPPDTEAPTAPSNLSSSNVKENSVDLSWTASTDNVGVTGYDIYKDGSYLANTSSTNYTVAGLSASTTYEFYVKAKDEAGNVSAASNTLDVTTLAENTAPIADAGGPYSGDQGTAISFDGTGSSDADGDALTYNWDFGDGATGTGATPTHTYTTAGSYTATLTVSDGIDSDQATASVTVNSTTVDQPMISAISLSTRTSGPWNRVSGTVTITSNGQPLSNAFVEGYWSDGVSSSVSGYTGSDGTLSMEELKSKSSSFTFTITNITLSGYYWDIENSQVSASTSSQSYSVNSFSNQLPFNVYPNPVTNGSLTITLPEIGNGVEIVIYDINGSARIKKQITNVVSEIPVQDLSAGVYILKVEGHNEPQRIIIK